ncbi:hypothetical protein [Moorena sp. SIO3H5]|uniref:hypothetical protein n=1 Tax=Moorena sp. SIO3H5 TaxID=2607834 RepID=UPI0025FFD469|nr:hypothetical protein [Moorena sp. SIO3H5]
MGGTPKTALHCFRQAIAYIELRLYQFLALTGLQIINVSLHLPISPHFPNFSHSPLSPSFHLPTRPTRPLSPHFPHFPHSLLLAPCSLFSVPFAIN